MDFVYGLLLFVAFIAVLAFVIQKLAKAALKRIEKREQKYGAQNNIFVQAHKQMLKEEKMYKEYLQWMDKNNVPGVPFEPAKSREQHKADTKINQLFR